MKVRCDHIDGGVGGSHIEDDCWRWRSAQSLGYGFTLVVTAIASTLVTMFDGRWVYGLLGNEHLVDFRKLLRRMGADFVEELVEVVGDEIGNRLLPGQFEVVHLAVVVFR